MKRIGATANSGGQAMVEFAIASAGLALLMVGLPVITRLHSLQLAGIEAARVAAFVDSWGAPASESVAAAAWREQMAGDNEAQDQAHLAAVTLQYTRGAPPGLAAPASQLLLAPFRPLQAVGGGFDLATGGQHRAQFSAVVAWPDTVSEPFAGLAIDFHEHFELQGEQWSSSGPSQVASRAGGLLMPPGAQALRPLTGLAADLLSLIEPAWRKFCPGFVNPEIVPSDRLRESASGVTGGGARTRWRATC